MESIYIALFVLFAIPAAFLEYADNACFGLLSSGRGQQHKQEYLRFRNNYVVIFSLMMGKLCISTSLLFQTGSSYAADSAEPVAQSRGSFFCCSHATAQPAACSLRSSRTSIQQ